MTPVEQRAITSKLPEESKEIVGVLAAVLATMKPSSAAVVGECFAALVLTMPEDVREAYENAIVRLTPPMGG